MSVRASWTKSLARSAAALVLAWVSVGSVPGIASAATPGSQPRLPGFEDGYQSSLISRGRWAQTAGLYQSRAEPPC